MVTSATGSDALTNLSNSYVKKETDEDPLGMDAFLTMLVAQMQNQDPLNPAEGTEFSTQLAQFSQLEQAMNTNTNLENLIETMSSGSETNLEGHLGKEVLASVNAIEVDGGEAVGGYYTMEEHGDVRVNIYDKSGRRIRTLYPGQKDPGSHAVSWDGLDSNGNKVEDGTYNYEVLANSGTGFQSVQTTVNGKVDGIIYKDGTAYLQVGGAFVRPDSVIKVWEPETVAPDDETQSLPLNPVSYIGNSVEAVTGVMGVTDGEAPEMPFDLAEEDEVRVQIYDASGNIVRTLDLGTVEAGEQTIDWDGKDESGNDVANGVYGYQVLTKGAFADTKVTGEVDGVVYVGGKPFLQVGDKLINPSDIVKVSGGS
jgi:flagellar basal-body rod modification protein FlgD